ncbi:DUF4832 domain-containing protein [Psychromicrobium sp. YIM B11713]|uniref:DUF4832 domain-containing protein n=1 Tax=Psychromicrobium sp. YIM B11713 TaxID=3145233 RepID=UPI00374FA8F4
MVSRLRLKSAKYTYGLIRKISASAVLTALFSAALVSPAFVTTASAATQTVTPTEQTGVLLNPGKGWVVYGDPSNQTAETMARASVAYKRFVWGDFEPTSGVYNWTALTNYIDEWAAKGKKIAFGIMAEDSCSVGSYLTPKWVFDAGAASTVGNVTSCDGKNTVSQRHTPVWNDPIFLASYQAMLKALAAKFDNNPAIAFIDVRSYGDWGEGHLGNLKNSMKISDADLRSKHLQMFLDSFNKIPVITPWGTEDYNASYDWAVNNGIGIRRDGMMGGPNDGGSDGSEVTRAYGKSLGVYEFIHSYHELKSHWSDSQFNDEVALGKPSYVGMGQWDGDAQEFLTDKQSQIDQWQNKIGYHFVLSSASLPNNISTGTSYPVSLSWNNKGVDYSYEPMRTAFALLDPTSNEVKAQYFPETGTNPGRLAPGVTNETTNLMFNNVAPGNYKLAIGIFNSNELFSKLGTPGDINSTTAHPAYNLAITGKTPNGWYPLLNSVAVGGTGSYSTPSPIYETEFAPASFSEGKHDLKVRDNSLSSGMGDRFNATAVGQQISYTIDVPQSGTYDLRAAAKLNNSSGVFQAKLDDQNLGSPQDLYSSAETAGESFLGRVSLSSGRHKVQFVSTGKNISSSGYALTTDFIRLVSTANLLTNPGFENGLTSWYTSGTAPGTAVSDGNTHSGSVSLKASASTPFTTWVENSVTAPKTGSYTAKVWHQGVGSWNSAVLQAYRGSTLLTQTDLKPTTNWSNTVLSSINVSSGDTVKLAIWIDGAAGSRIYLDDFELIAN